VADLLEVVGVCHVITVDLHTQQIEGFFHAPVDSLTAVPTLRKVEPRHVKCQQAEPIVVWAARRWAGAAIAHPAEVVHCLMRANRSLAAYARNRRTYVEDRSVTECAAGRIGIIDDQIEAFRTGGRAVPGEGWRHVLASAGIDVWYSAIRRKSSGFQLESHNILRRAQALSEYQSYIIRAVRGGGDGTACRRVGPAFDLP
jgi:hypothetical protein